MLRSLHTRRTSGKMYLLSTFRSSIISLQFMIKLVLGKIEAHYYLNVEDTNKRMLRAEDAFHALTLSSIKFRIGL